MQIPDDPGSWLVGASPGVYVQEMPSVSLLCWSVPARRENWNPTYTNFEANIRKWLEGILPMREKRKAGNRKISFILKDNIETLYKIVMIFYVVMPWL